MTLPKHVTSRIVLRMIPRENHIWKVAVQYMIGRPIQSPGDKTTLNALDISDPAAL